MARNNIRAENQWNGDYNTVDRIDRVKQKQTFQVDKQD